MICNNGNFNGKKIKIYIEHYIWRKLVCFIDNVLLWFKIIKTAGNVMLRFDFFSNMVVILWSQEFWRIETNSTAGTFSSARHFFKKLNIIKLSIPTYWTGPAYGYSCKDALKSILKSTGSSCKLFSLNVHSKIVQSYIICEWGVITMQNKISECNIFSILVFIFLFGMYLY